MGIVVFVCGAVGVAVVRTPNGAIAAQGAARDAAQRATPTRAPRKGVPAPSKPARRVPKDVPAHMSWEGLGGGGASPVCLDVNKLLPPPPTASLTETLLPAGVVYWCYCNLKEAVGTQVTARLTLADGTRQTLRTRVADDETGEWERCALFEHHFPVAPAPGLITFTARLSGRAITDVTNAVVGELVFAGWRSNEPIRLISYVSEDTESNRKTFAGELRTQADANGELRVQTAETGQPIPVLTIFAVGRDSNCQTYDAGLSPADQVVASGCETSDPDIVGASGWPAIVTWTYEGPPLYEWQPCEDAPHSNLIRGQSAVVRLNTVTLRAEANSRAGITGRLRRNDVVTIQGAPQCGEGAVWWSVIAAGSGTSGWVKEHDGRQAWLARAP